MLGNGGNPKPFSLTVPPSLLAMPGLNVTEAQETLEERYAGDPVRLRFYKKNLPLAGWGTPQTMYDPHAPVPAAR